MGGFKQDLSVLMASLRTLKNAAQKYRDPCSICCIIPSLCPGHPKLYCEDIIRELSICLNCIQQILRKNIQLPCRRKATMLFYIKDIAKYLKEVLPHFLHLNSQLICHKEDDLYFTITVCCLYSTLPDFMYQLNDYLNNVTQKLAF